jgi:hypothetical protein
MNNPTELTTLEHFTNILERLSIAYAIGGSLASSTYGAVRFTEDADITVEPFDKQAEEFFESLQSNYYISKEAMYQALKQRTSLNVIHLESAFKIDVFVSGNSAYERQVMSRRKATKLSGSPHKSFSVVSPEDIVLLKLQWYQAGGLSSQHQWDDVLGVLRVQADALDFEYLRRWAGKLEIDKLLEKAISEAT